MLVSKRVPQRRFARCVGAFACLLVAAPGSAQVLSRAPEIVFHDSYEGTTAGPFNDSDASRFLTQATFGPTDADIAHLRAVGYQAWLTEQFNATPTYEMDYMNWVASLGEYPGNDNRAEAWFLGALGGPDPDPAKSGLIHSDQLRQRMAFALSEIFVVSRANTVLDLYGGKGLAYYNDILVRNAFGNYRQLLEQVTLSPAMGTYLNMVGNRRADLSHNQHPDENYGREINQLFSIGLVMLNTDGTLQSGAPIPTYMQSTITNFAHVFTGWNWPDCDANGYDNFSSCGPDENTGANFLSPMIAFETAPPNSPGAPNYHDNGTDPVNDIHNKKLLSYTGAVNGGVLADGGTAQSDLTFALDNIFNHPNVGPFISKQLIQRLVTSNPSPAYVQRVASVFNDDGSAQHVRGNLQAVAAAILLDPEARYGQWRNPDTFGKLREPLLTLTHLWRAMGAVHVCGVDLGLAHYNNNYRYAGYTTAWSTGGTQYGGVDQAPLDAPTVFNFFKPGYIPAGEMSTRNLLGPEFQISTDSIVANTSNDFAAFYIPYDSSICDPNEDPPIGNVKINHAPDLALAGNANGGPGDPADVLVEAYNKRFMSGQMSPFMRQTLLTYLNPISSSWGADWKTARVNRALFLIFTSPEYMVQK